MNIQLKHFLSIISIYALLSRNMCAHVPENTFSVVTASPAYTFATAFRALIVKPSTSNMHYAAEAIPLPVPSPHWNIYDIHPSYHFGFDLAFTGFFHDLNTNLAINWERFHSCDGSCVNVGTNNMVGPFFEIGPDALPYTIAEGRSTFHFDEVNALYGQNVDFGCRLHTNFFAGIGFTHIKQQLNAIYSNTDANIARTIKTPTQLNAGGPQVGIDFSYDIVAGLELAGRGSASILTGRLNNSTSYSSISPALALLEITPPNTQSTRACSRLQVVPAFNQRIGFAYSHEFCNRYFLKLEVGYQAQIYLNALQSVDMSSEVVTPPVTPDTIGVFARTFQRNLSNFALTGPYVTLNVGF